MCNNFTQKLIIALSCVLTSLVPLAASTVAPEGTRRAEKRLAVGGYFSCAMRGDGTVRCWGDNSDGQLGDGTTTDRSTPVTVVGLANVIAIAAGDRHVCALAGGGTVSCWGDNRFGQLGDGTTTHRSTPVTVVGLTNVTAIAAAGGHTCAVLVSSEVRCWGLNLFGQLGDGTWTDSTSPVTVIGVSGASLLSGVVEVAAGNYHTCALTVAAEVYCWGLNLVGQVAAPALIQFTPFLAETNALQVSAGDYHTCAVQTDRTLRCWGLNADGQLGDGTRTNRFTPVAAVSGAPNVVGIAGGFEYSCLMRLNSSVECWGSDSHGKLGNGALNNRLTPGTPVLDLSSAVAVGLGAYHACALLAGDSVRCWGGNNHGQLGDGTLVGQQSPVTALGHGNDKARFVSMGTEHTCAVRSTGKADCWGDNLYGQLGDGSNIARVTPNSAIPVTGLTNVLQVGAGNAFGCSLEAGGRVKCWGLNSLGQLGNGTNINGLTPVVVSGDLDAVTISVSEEHACALKQNGRVGCWGSNTSGQLGDGTTANRSAPVTVSGLTDAVMVASGWYHTCALRVGGTVKCWGSNSNGQLGDGTTIQRVVPGTVTGLARVVSISAGRYHTCARLNGGAVQCWGLNDEGQLGDGTTTQRPTPVTVSGVTTAVTVTANAEFSCALLADGTARCWGDNYHGQLGDGTTTDRLTRVTVSGLANILSLGATSDNLLNMANCALLASGVPYCWGNNSVGKLGDGTTTNRSTPTAVLTF